MHKPDQPFTLASLTHPAASAVRSTGLSPQESARACIAIAESLEQAGSYEAAAAQYLRARESAPQEIAYARRLAVLYAQLKQPTAARREFKAAIEQTPRDADLHNDYGHFLASSGDAGEAENIFRKIIAEHPGHDRAANNLGILLAKQSRYEEAFQTFQPIIGAAAAHFNIGVILAGQGNHEQAQRAFQQAQAADPNMPQPQAFLAAYARQEDLKATGMNN